MRQSTRTPDIKELCSFDDSEEAAACVEVQKILSEQPEMPVNEIKSPTDRRKPRAPRVDTGCGSPCIPSTVVTESESEEETALTDEETVESSCNVSSFNKILRSLTPAGKVTILLVILPTRVKMTF